MGIGVSVFLMAVGAILAFAVNVPADGINLDTVGVSGAGEPGSSTSTTTPSSSTSSRTARWPSAAG